ncbi:armadillo-type protein [Paraphysoderma sedebokerense]|nr:armadillo-type protein [Paraphysoderma sedebokerense]
MTMTVPLLDRPTDIDQIVQSIERYNPGNITALEGYLKEQCENQQYDLHANLTLLKLYQFNSDSDNVDFPTMCQNITLILAKALTALPSSDFNLCLYLLNENIVEDKEFGVKQLIDVHSLLEECRFEEAWKEIKSTDGIKDMVKSVKGFEDGIIRFISHLISTSHQRISVTLSKKYLDLNDSALGEYAKKQGWKVSGQMIEIPANKDNSVRGVVVQENIRFEQLTKIITNSTAL